MNFCMSHLQMESLFLKALQLFSTSLQSQMFWELFFPMKDLSLPWDTQFLHIYSPQVLLVPNTLLLDNKLNSLLRILRVRGTLSTSRP